MKITLILAALALSFFFLAAGVNIKKEYCKDYVSGTNKENEYFVGNPPNKYPHLHCGKDFLTFSESNKKTNYEKPGMCKRIIKTFMDNPGLHKDITKVLEHFFKDNCPNEKLPVSDVNKTKSEL